MAKKSKYERKRELRVTAEKEQALDDALRFSKKRFKKLDEVITQLYEGCDFSRFFNTDERLRKMKACFESVSKKDAHAGEQLRDMFILLNNNSVLMQDARSVHAVYNVFRFRQYWRNSISGWQPCEVGGSNQFIELVDHLICKYKVPAFLYNAFSDSGDQLYMQWFVHLAGGGKVREMKNLPVKLTQKMAHYFTLAPEKLQVTQALRWAQVRGSGGEEKLASRVAYSWIGTKPFGDEVFWESFIQLLSGDGMFNHEKLTELIDYVRETRRADPGYVLKGRTLQSLLRQSDKWHGTYKQLNGNWSWIPCGIGGLKVERKTEKVIMEELTEGKRLVEEGRAMKHCVASYAQACVKGRTAIFSLRKYSEGVLINTLATIEVNLFLRSVVQAKAKMNHPIPGEARKYMEQWAGKNGLSINPYV